MMKRRTLHWTAHEKRIFNIRLANVTVAKCSDRNGEDLCADILKGFKGYTMPLS